LKSKGNFPAAVNLAVCDPADFVTNERFVRTAMACRDGFPPSIAIFFLTGVVTFNGLDSDLTKIKQICVAPFTSGWTRSMAVCRQFFDSQYLGVNSFMNGVSFATAKYLSKSHLWQFLNVCLSSTTIGKPGEDGNRFRPVIPNDGKGMR
jgi:hypothetical protein